MNFSVRTKLPLAVYKIPGDSLQHSLSNWLVNKAKIEPKTVQGILRHSKIQTTLDLYNREDGNETRAAQGKYLMALRAATQVLQ